MRRFDAFTFVYPGLARELMTEVGIALPVRPTDKTPKPLVTGVKSIWDTGATDSAITAAVAEEIGATPIAQVLVGGVHGKQYVNSYLISMFLPNNVYIPEMEVTELGDSAGCDILIGMDIIACGEFSISTLGGETTFSFRIPPCQKNDFVRYFPKDNHPCTCGSGNMFKNCCKKINSD